MWVLFVKQWSSVSEPPFRGLRGNVCDSSFAHWKARSQLTVGYNWTFLASSYGWITEWKYVELGLCWRGGSLWGWILGCTVMFTTNIYIQHWIGEWFFYNVVAESFYRKEPCSKVYSNQINFYSQKRQIRFLRGNVCASSIARWKASGQVPIRDYWTFLQHSRALLAMPSAVLATAIPYVRPSVCHMLVPYTDEWT